MTVTPPERPPVVLRDLAPLPGPELAEVDVGQAPVPWLRAVRALNMLSEGLLARHEAGWRVEVAFDSQHELMVLVAVRGEAP